MSLIESQEFELHPGLGADTLPVVSLCLSDVLLMNDSRYLWCILVPRVAGLRDFHDLPADCKLPMLEEIDRVSAVIEELSNAYKINVAALGNMVEQLHIHVIARHRNDTAWPGPVWGVGDAEPYSNDNANGLIEQISKHLAHQAPDKTRQRPAT